VYLSHAASTDRLSRSTARVRSKPSRYREAIVTMIHAFGSITVSVITAARAVVFRMMDGA
jgi:hypothetical protein